MSQATPATTAAAVTDPAIRGEKPTTLVIRTAGTNCDAELCRAFELAGASARLVHLDALCRRPAEMDGARMIALPGGFSYGDDIASGRVLAARIRAKLWPAFRAALDRRTPVLGVCNGFQALVQLGLLPGPEGDLGDAAPTPTVALTDNDSGRFVDRWVQVEAHLSSPCIWTASLRATQADGGGSWSWLPIAHAEGRLVTTGDDVTRALLADGRAALRYRENPNGSAGGIAGLCDRSGLIFGLMPHPERYLDWALGPEPRDGAAGDTPGLSMFRDAVRFVAAEGA